MRRRRLYLSGTGIDGAYFTPRECEIMLSAMCGDTMQQSAIKLGLSPRTVEYYINNMRHKLSCENKKQLIHKVKHSNFIQSLRELIRKRMKEREEENQYSLG